MAIGRIKIGKLNFTFVFRHRFEKKDEKYLWRSITMWHEWELGLWFKRLQVVGKKNFNNPSKWKNHYVHEYMFGINLLWCKAWFTVEKGAMNLEIDDEKIN